MIADGTHTPDDESRTKPRVVLSATLRASRMPVYDLSAVALATTIDVMLRGSAWFEK